MQVGVLDKIVRQSRAQAEEDATTLPHWNVEPWPEEVIGAALLDDINAILCRYIVLPKGAADAIALWTLHAWTADDEPSKRVSPEPSKRVSHDPPRRLHAGVHLRRPHFGNAGSRPFRR
jgi:hypothetical protein